MGLDLELWLMVPRPGNALKILLDGATGTLQGIPKLPTESLVLEPTWLYPLDQRYHLPPRNMIFRLTASAPAYSLHHLRPRSGAGFLC